MHYFKIYTGQSRGRQLNEFGNVKTNEREDLKACLIALKVPYIVVPRFDFCNFFLVL